MSDLVINGIAGAFGTALALFVLGGLVALPMLVFDEVRDLLPARVKAAPQRPRRR
jgi:hypothetical protein